ncbi:MAG: hypothetical protein V1848_02510 [Candidatus Magasanikbacteria bacterium]
MTKENGMKDEKMVACNRMGVLIFSVVGLCLTYGILGAIFFSK